MGSLRPARSARLNRDAIGDLTGPLADHGSNHDGQPVAFVFDPGQASLRVPAGGQIRSMTTTGIVRSALSW